MARVPQAIRYSSVRTRDFKTKNPAAPAVKREKEDWGVKQDQPVRFSRAPTDESPDVPLTINRSCQIRQIGTNRNMR